VPPRNGKTLRAVERVDDAAEADERVLDHLAQLGCNPSEARETRHFLYVPAQDGAEAVAAALGADVMLISGPVNLPDPAGVKTVKVETAQDMLAAVTLALPADVAVFAAAVADWRVESASRHKLKKDGSGPPMLRLAENPDILSRIAQRGNDRPALVIAFAAETDDIVGNARLKLQRKRCDWILANDVSPGTGTFGGDRNTIHLVDADGVEDWPVMTKREVATRLAERVVVSLGRQPARSP